MDAVDAGPLPCEFVAYTVNVYVCPLVNPLTVVLVAGGDPLTTVGGDCAVLPMNAVTV